jgi:hypothetical protein
LGGQEGRVVVTRVSTLLLCLYSDKTAQFGMLKAKVGSASLLFCYVALPNQLQRPLFSANTCKSHFNKSSDLIPFTLSLSLYLAINMHST